MLPNLIDRLLLAGIISGSEALATKLLAEQHGQLAASAVLLEAWATREETTVTKGAAEHPVFRPDPTLYPDIGVSTFRPWVWLLLLGEEQIEVRDYIYKGFTEGFEITSQDIQFESVEYPNVGLDTVEEKEAVNKTVRVESAAGCIGRRPPWMRDFIRSPIFPVPKKSDGEPSGQFRLAQHLSKGSKEHPAVNAYINDEDAQFKMDSIDTAVDAILDVQEEEAGRTDEKIVIPMTVKDAKRAFRIMPLKTKCYPLTGWMDLEGQEWFEAFLMFGLRCAPRMYSALSNTIGWILRALGIRAVIVYIDDFLLISVGHSQSELAARVACAVFRLLGIPLQEDKEQEQSSTKVKFLGFMVDTQHNLLSLTEGRWARLKVKVQEWLGRTEATSREIAQLTGHLCHATKVVRAGRLFLWRLFAKIAYGEQRSHRIKFPAKVRLGIEFHKDLHWWDGLMEYHRFARLTRAVKAFTKLVFTDACSSFGCGGYVPADRTFWQLEWTGTLAYMAKKNGTHINVQEMFALPVMAMIGGPGWKGEVVLFRCDNLGDVHSVKKRKNKNKHIMHLMRVLHYLSALFDFVLRIEYVNTLDNLADAPSRRPALSLAQDPKECSIYVSQLQVEWLPPRPNDLSWEAQLTSSVQQRLAREQASGSSASDSAL